MSPPPRLAAVAAVLALAAFVVATVHLYVGHEATFYWWDYAVHQELATRTALAFRASFAEGWDFVDRSTGEDYNALLAVPLVPILNTFGTSRVVYLLGLAFVYLAPFALCLGSIAAVVIHGPRRAIFWTTAAVALLTPMTWIPLLRGYPDVGAALLVALAVRVCVADVTLRRPRTILLAGALLALAAICRRHFLLAGPPLLVAVALCATAGESSVAGRRAAVRRILAAAGRILLTAAWGVVVAFLVARPVAVRWLRHDFYGLYTGYLTSTGQLTLWYVAAYGWLAWAGAAAGFAAGLRTGVAERRPALLIGGFGGAAVVQWLVIVRQVGEQYTLHFTPVIVVGLAMLGWTLWTKRSALGRVVQAACAFYVVVNVAFGLADWRFVGQVVPLRPALAGNWPPLVHGDPKGVARLVDGLRRSVRPDESIFVVGSSQALNPDLLRNAERVLYGRDGARLQFDAPPALDSRDRYPLEALLRAQYAVVAYPLQLHLPAAEQRVVQVVYDMFRQHAAMARDFEPTGELFVLRGVASARIFRRARFSSLETGLETLRHFQEVIPRRPGMQADWVIVSGRYPAWTYRRADGTSTLVWHPTRADDPFPSVALLLNTPPATIHARGSIEFVDRRCRGAALHFGFLGSDGAIHDAPVPEIVRRPGEPEAFEASFEAAPGSGRMVLRLWPPAGQSSIDFCLLRLDRLEVR